MKTISNSYDYLTATDIEAIAKKTMYSTKTIYALLAGRRRMTARNKVVFELAGKISAIRRKEQEQTTKKIEKCIM